MQEMTCNLNKYLNKIVAFFYILHIKIYDIWTKTFIIFAARYVQITKSALYLVFEKKIYIVSRKYHRLHQSLQFQITSF